jgi:hypothetical protein
MAKWHFTLLISLIILACENNDRLVPAKQVAKVQRVQEKQEEKLLIPPATKTHLPAEALSWDADVLLSNFNSAQEEKVLKAITLIKKVIASEEFRTRILNYSFNGKNEFFENAGLTNEQIYQKILDGAESINGNKNNAMDVELELYTEATTTIGYTYPDTTRIWMNTKYFDKYTPIEVSDNLTHEWMHKLGFNHAPTYSPSRDFSVPYAIGYLMEELARKY